MTRDPSPNRSKYSRSIPSDPRFWRIHIAGVPARFAVRSPAYRKCHYRTCGTLNTSKAGAFADGHPRPELALEAASQSSNADFRIISAGRTLDSASPHGRFRLSARSSSACRSATTGIVTTVPSIVLYLPHACARTPDVFALHKKHSKLLPASRTRNATTVHTL